VMRQYVDVDGLVSLTSSMVAVGTPNPPGNEAALAGILRSALDRWHPSWTEVEPAPGRLSLVARLPAPADSLPPGTPEARSRRPTLIVNGHTDVVPVVPERWARDPFSPTVVAGRLYGRGSADMKGGVAAAICALATLEAAGEAPACDIVFQFVADEERGGALGTRARRPTLATAVVARSCRRGG